MAKKGTARCEHWELLWGGRADDSGGDCQGEMDQGVDPISVAGVLRTCESAS